MPATRTLQAQMDLILTSGAGVVASPPDWRESERGLVEVLYRERSIVTRSRDAERIERLVPEGGRRRLDSRAGLTRYSWDGDRNVVDVLEAIDREEPGTAGPDHLTYVCGHSCAAIEPEETASTEPFPAPALAPQSARPAGRNGAGVDVLVMDTGLVPNADTDHWWMASVTGDVDTLATSAATNLPQDAGHGTFTAGCVRVTAPEARVHVVNATASLPQEASGVIGACFESDLAELVRDQLVDESGQPRRRLPDILMLNFAGYSLDDGPLLAFDVLYEEVIASLLDRMVIVSPAGNDGTLRWNWPGAYPWVVSVGGLGEDWSARAPWSSYGAVVDVWAPGDRLTNAFATGDYVTAWDPTPGQTRRFDGMATWSGTSFAGPLVAGMIATRMSRTGENARQAWNALQYLAASQAVPGTGPVLYPGQS